MSDEDAIRISYGCGNNGHTEIRSDCAECNPFHPFGASLEIGLREHLNLQLTDDYRQLLSDYGDAQREMSNLSEENERARTRNSELNKSFKDVLYNYRMLADDHAKMREENKELWRALKLAKAQRDRAILMVNELITFPEQAGKMNKGWHPDQEGPYHAE